MNETDRLLAKLPYTKSLFGDDGIQKINNKFKIFADSSIAKERQIQRLSVTNKFDYELDQMTSGGRIPNMYYHQLMYNSSSDDKKKRIVDYRIMAQFPEVESALREICNEMFERDDQGELIKCVIRGDYNDEVKGLIEKEFQSFIKIFQFEERGWRYIWDWIVEGEIFFENVVSSKKPELGIIGTTRIAAERIDPLYYDMDNELIDSFLLRAKQPDQYPYQWGKYTAQSSYGAQNKHQLLFLNDKQITYFYNDSWESEGKKYRVPVLANAHRPYRQLSLIEDATIIYMLVRAPERLVFNIDTGNMKPSQQEQYMKRLMAGFWSKKTIGSDGRIENTYDAQGMMENYYFPKPREGTGSTVTSLGGGSASPDNLEILNFFVQKLYKALHVPLARLNSDTAFSDGESITREELKFAEFIITIQKIWAATLKKSFIVHLKLRGKKILEVAKKIGVDNIDIPNKNKGTDTLKVSAVYKDAFDFKCWDAYDVLAEAINSKFETLDENYNKIEDTLQEELESLNHSESQILNNVILETEDYNIKYINENRISILEELEELTYKREETKNIKEDGTSWWEQYELKEEDIDVKFNEPTQFFALREQQIFQMKYDNYNNMSQNDLISNTFAQKIYLGYKDDEVLANQNFLRKDAAFRWELSQIESNGPDFREKAIAEMKGTMGDDGGLEGLGGGLPGGGGGGGSLPSPTTGGDTTLPAFGDKQETPETSGTEGTSSEENSPSNPKPPNPPPGK